MSDPFTALDANIAKLEQAISAAKNVSTFNMRPAIERIMAAAYGVNLSARLAINDLRSRVVILETRGAP